MPRLLTSLGAAAAALADQAADRLDAWVENHASNTEAPREEPLGFAVPTGTVPPDIQDMMKAAADRGLTGEQRARWVTELEQRLSRSTGGPWCSDGNPIISPYGLIVTGVTREADRDLIENARGDLFGLLAVIKYQDNVITAWENSDPPPPSSAAEHELAGMKARERDVEYVLDHVVDGRLNLREHIDPETPAGRVKELVTTLLTQIRDAENGDQVQHLNDALHVANNNNVAIKQELDRTRALLEHARTDGSASHLEVAAVMGAYDRGLTLTDIKVREDSLAERVLAALIVERARATDLERKLDRHHRHDAELITADDVRAAAAARIREAADLADLAINVTPADSDVDAAAADAFVAGLRGAANIILDQTPEADPNVAHIDTVNGRAAAADETPDDMPVVTPGSFIETVLATGGTVVIDDNGDPHVTDVLIGNDPAAIGTLITADGKRHRFTKATASPVDGYVRDATEPGEAEPERAGRVRADRDDEALDG
jgi:hypothetical protein